MRFAPLTTSYDAAVPCSLGSAATHSTRSSSIRTTTSPQNIAGAAPMIHRHLNHQDFTLAAIDDTIARGKRADWAALRRALLADRAIGEKVLRVCEPQVADPTAQRYHFWKGYVERRLA